MVFYNKLRIGRHVLSEIKTQNSVKNDVWVYPCCNHTLSPLCWRHRDTHHLHIYTTLSSQQFRIYFSCFWVTRCHKLGSWMTPHLLINHNSLWAPTMPLSSWSSSCMYNKSVYFKLHVLSLTYFVFQNEIARRTTVWRVVWEKDTRRFWNAPRVFLQKAKHVWRLCKVYACTHDEGVLSTHRDDCAVDDSQQRHHDVLDVLKRFPLRKAETESGVKERECRKNRQRNKRLLDFL